MAVYTPLDAATLRDLIALYDVGELAAFEPIVEGVSNSNWRVETSGSWQGSRFVLTLYERRIDAADVPYFLALLDHLSAKGCRVPRTIHTRTGKPFVWVGEKPAALIAWIAGQSIEQPGSRQVHGVGQSLAQIHAAAADFPLSREQTLGLSAWRALVTQTGAEALDGLQPGLASLLDAELAFLEQYWPSDLPKGTIHSDLFPDNVLMCGDRVSGLIDFYFSATDLLAYDLAVTHAAWCFAPDGQVFYPELSKALLAGYEAVRPLSPAELAVLPVLARGAAMRFIASRAYDWMNTLPAATVRRKDPLAFVNRLVFYQRNGDAIFTSGLEAGKNGA